MQCPLRAVVIQSMFAKFEDSTHNAAACTHLPGLGLANSCACCVNSTSVESHVHCPVVDAANQQFGSCRTCRVNAAGLLAQHMLLWVMLISIHGPAIAGAVLHALGFIALLSQLTLPADGAIQKHVLAGFSYASKLGFL